MLKILKIAAVTAACIAVMAVACVLSYFIITKDAVLDKSKLTTTQQSITIYDKNGDEIVSAYQKNNRKAIKLAQLPKDTVNAFIASEDRNFYSHHGLNYKRMLKAAYKNVLSRSFKEGASTISQQLIKNTHLSGDKTISRKLKEIRLTKKLEKHYSKDKILEMYLNTIYFGHNCYGLQSAAEFYFGKNAETLTTEESAVLAGLLISPNNYSPFKHPEKSLTRRNVVLKAMRDCKFISDARYSQCLAEPLNVSQNNNSGYGDEYINAVFDELEAAELNFYNISSGCKIYTNLQPELQDLIEKTDYPCDNAIIVTTSDNEVAAYKSTIGDSKRQPGSTIKPLAVYAPAIEEKLINPYTKILDDKIDFNGYSPSNNDNRYHGYISATECLARSYNIPAVKILNSLTVDKAEKYLNKMNIKLEESEKNLSLALGGMTHGFSIKQIADCYNQFANSGIYAPSTFIRKIEDENGKLIYEPKKVKSRAFSEGTASLINQMLIETAKSGTAKMLRNLPYDVAAKTGTCGDKSGNTDAYSVAYTSENCVAVWLGDGTNKKLDITGGNQSCKMAQTILNKLYADKSPKKLETSKGTKTVKIDAELYYDSNKIEIADDISPQLNLLQIKTLESNIPATTSTRFSTPTICKPEIKVENNSVFIDLCQTKYYSYIVKRANSGIKTTIYDGKWKKSITDSPPDGTYLYSVCPYYFDGTARHFGKEINVGPIFISSNKQQPQIKIPHIINGDWYNI